MLVEEQSNLEQTWLEQARAGDRTAFGHLVNAYQRPVFNIAYRFLRDPDEVEEVAQEVFIRAFTRLHTYDPKQKFSTWLFAITSNYCIDVLRKRKAHLVSIDDIVRHDALQSEPSQRPEAQLMLEERKAYARSLVEALSPMDRDAVVLRYWYEMPYEKIAETLDTTVNAVKSRLSRARRQLEAISMTRDIGLPTPLVG